MLSWSPVILQSAEAVYVRTCPGDHRLLEVLARHLCAPQMLSIYVLSETGFSPRNKTEVAARIAQVTGLPRAPAVWTFPPDFFRQHGGAGELWPLAIFELSGEQTNDAGQPLFQQLKLANLPPALSHMRLLRGLRLTYAHLTEVPQGIELLADQLQDLYLSGNQIQHIPERLGMLTQLHFLRLFENSISVVPEKTLGQLTQLEELRLNLNLISSLPRDLGRLTNLENIWLQHNLLSGLPESLGQLTRMDYLILRDNLLRSIPSSFGSLRRASRLYLEDNLLSSIPSSLGRLTALATLDVHNNSLTTIPASILAHYPASKTSSPTVHVILEANNISLGALTRALAAAPAPSSLSSATTAPVPWLRVGGNPACLDDKLPSRAGPWRVTCEIGGPPKEYRK